MKTHARPGQDGITLVVTLIMLVVLTLMVVAAIRFGNVNLKIAGNVQSQSEASAATQIAIERVLEQAKTASAINLIPASDPGGTPVNVGGAAYKVTWASPQCVLTKPVSNADLNPSKATDVPCFESQDQDKMVDANGNLTTNPSACNDQQWGVQAAVNDATTGANVTSYQGFSIRVTGETPCP